MQKIYNKEDLVKVAKRDNNNKRTFLLVNPLQGKHIPVSPTAALELFKKLANKLINKYPNEKFLVIGFAETATAIGATIAAQCPEGTKYIHTTRETIKNSEYLFFSEAHSHAVEQKLVKNNLKEMIEKTDRIIFAEDEITTGNTIWNIKNILEEQYSKKKLNFGVISILNGMNKKNMEKFNEFQIECIYEIKLSAENYDDQLNKYSYENERRYNLKFTENFLIKEYSFNEYIDAKLGADSRVYEKNCSKLAELIIKKLKKEEFENKDVLVLGTEEFMYPAMITGEKLEKEYKCNEVKFHAVTRSPILPSGEKDYPLYLRHELRSLYDKNRVVYLYNLKKYDKVVIIHDSKSTKGEGIKSLIAALKEHECNDISIFQWSDLD
ncbi:phosphoribosyltransferase domain-containing protein [Fusobacterium varium]|uniref:phosphoribosyltransferase domain-containing protein n=1 Tax=Fusobacterium varium TaxID=856 RepID=UPI00356199C9